MTDLERLHQTVIVLLDHGVSYVDAMQAFERLFIAETIERHKGNRLQAAQAMAMHRNTLHRKTVVLSIPGRKPATP